jgi:uncharacterized protein (UPF0335 family)
MSETQYDPYAPRAGKPLAINAKVAPALPSGDEVPMAQRGVKEMFSAEETGEERVQGVAAAELRQFVERVERLEEEKQTLVDDVKEIYAEAKGRGYDTKIIRIIVRLRKKDANERKEEEAILELYMNTLGMV